MHSYNISFNDLIKCTPELRASVSIYNASIVTSITLSHKYLPEILTIYQLYQSFNRDMAFFTHAYHRHSILNINAYYIEIFIASFM